MVPAACCFCVPGEVTAVVVARRPSSKQSNVCFSIPSVLHTASLGLWLQSTCPSMCARALAWHGVRCVRAGPSVRNQIHRGAACGTSDYNSPFSLKGQPKQLHQITVEQQFHKVTLATSNISGTQVPENVVSRRHIQVPSSLMAIYTNTS